MELTEKTIFENNKGVDLILQSKTLAARIAWGLLGTVIFIMLWSLIGYGLFSRPGYEQFSGFLPIPTMKALYQLVLEKNFWQSVLDSLRRVSAGIIIAFIIGLPLGLIIGFYRTLRTITHPPIQFLRMISPLSWMPIALLVFNTFESAIYFLITMATVWPIVLNTTLGVSRVNPHWTNMAKNQGATNFQLIYHIVIPASIPHILVSLRLALGIAWIVLVPAEFLGVTSGLGYLINDARDILEYDRLMAILIAIGIIGFIVDSSIKAVQNYFSWSWS